MTSLVPLTVLLAGSVSTLPVAMLVMGPKSLPDTWPMAHVWVAAPVQAATLIVAPAFGPVTSRHLPLIRSVPSL